MKTKSQVKKMIALWSAESEVERYTDKIEKTKLKILALEKNIELYTKHKEMWKRKVREATK